MGNSIFLARLMGPYLAVVALGIMFNQKIYQKIMEDFFKNTALIYLGGAFALVIGLLIVLSHNIWILGWQVIITIFGWLALLKGIWLIILPDSVVKLTQAYQKKSGLLVGHSLVILVLGACLIYIGYFAV